MAMTIKEFEQINEAEMDILDQLNQEIFREFTDDVFSRKKLADTANNVAGLHFLVAFDGDKPVAFKTGYRHSGSRFYSWLGGVLRSHRGQGLAKQLMEKQHAWVRERGYTVVETRTKNRFRDMLITNLKYGFDVVGTTQSIGDTEPTLILEKRLADPNIGAPTD